MTTEIVLACGHPAIAKHDKGGRLIKCGECDLTSVVQATYVQVVKYQISPLAQQFQFHVGKVNANSEDDVPLQQT